MRGAEAPEPGVASTGRRMLTQEVGRCEGLGARARADYLPERRGHGARKSWRAPTWRRVILAFSPPAPENSLLAASDSDRLSGQRLCPPLEPFPENSASLRG